MRLTNKLAPTVDRAVVALSAVAVPRRAVAREPGVPGFRVVIRQAVHRADVAGVRRVVLVRPGGVKVAAPAFPRLFVDVVLKLVVERVVQVVGDARP